MIPHFDTMTNDELWAFHTRYSNASRKDAAALIGDTRPGYTTIARSLANYACNLAVARQCKERGDSVGHDIYMHCVHSCTEKLPRDIRGRLWVRA